MTIGKRCATTLAALGLMLATATTARAICDVIPQPEVQFPGATANVNRVFAGEGDVVALSRDAAGCDAGTPDFGVTPGSDRIVTLVFTPPSGPASAVVLGDGTYCAAGNWVTGGLQAACEAQLGAGGEAFCVTTGTVAGGAEDLSFRLRSQGRTGPVKIAVSDSSGAPICQIATQRCADQTGLSACIDELYQPDTCETEALNRHSEFPGVTALPDWNDFEGICDSSDPSIPCNNSGADVEFTTDAKGNLIVPIDWRGVLVQSAVPIPRLVNASSSIAAFVGAPPEPNQTPGAPIAVPGLGFLQSFSPKGLRVDPLFNPLFNENASSDTELFGSADAEFGVIRVLRRSPEFRQCLNDARGGLPCLVDAECPNSTCVPALCRGGSNDGQACTGDTGCPSGACGAALFDFGDRYSGVGGATEVGPVVLTNAQYTAEALNPAAIDGLAATEDLFMFVRSEPLEEKDLNQDGDLQDETIVTLRNAVTGDSESIGNGGSLGPASTRVHQFPFAFPAVAVEGDVLALLESEPDEGGDANGDGDDWDTALRIFRLEAGGAVDLLGGAAPAADGLTRIDRASLAVSDGFVFFRESEIDGAARTTTYPGRFGRVASGTPDGRYVAFIDLADNAAAGDSNGCDDVFVLDRDTDADGIYDEVGATTITLISKTSAGAQGDGVPACNAPPIPFLIHHLPEAPAISADGRHVVFTSTFANLVPGDTNGVRDVFVHDRDADADGIFDEPGAISTLRVSVDTAGNESTGGGSTALVSADGRWVVFEGDADDLVAGDANGFTDVFVRDRDSDQDGIFDEPGAVATLRLTDAVLGGDPPRGSGDAGISPDGRWVVFTWVITPPFLFPEAVILDRDADEDGIFDETGSTTLRSISVTTAGEAVNSGAIGPKISVDGRRILYEWSAPDFFGPLAEDPYSQIVLHDRDADGNGVFDEPGGIESRRVVRSQPTRAASATFLARFFTSLSPDGRRALVVSEETLISVGDPSDRYTDRIDLDTGVAAQTDQGIGPAWIDEIPTASAVMAGSGAFSAYRDDASGLALDGVDTSAPMNDLSGDGDQTDVVLAVADARAAAPVTITPLAPADEVAVAAGNAVFLRPESADGAGLDLNGDLDADDRVVHLWRNHRPVTGTLANLGLAAEQVAVSDQVVAALVSEAGEGALLNGDADQDDLVVHWNDLATGTSGTWQNLFVAADAIQAVGPYLAFTVPEADQGTSQNGDGDTGDRVLRVYDTSTSSYVSFEDELGTPIVGLAVDDFVLGDQAVAFRVNEFDQGQNLNGVAPPIPGGVADGDLLDAVLQVADLSTGVVYNSTQAAIPCPVEACDPRIPYRLLGSKATFLTFEAHQGGNDLDQSGDSGTGLVLQHFNPDALAAGGEMEDACDLLGGALGGICTTSAEACATDVDCPGIETCYFPPGGCLYDSGTPCDPLNPVACSGAEFCAPSTGGGTTCQESQGPCLTDLDCSAPAVCIDDGDNPERLFGSFDQETDGRQRFVSEGRCTDGDGSCRNDTDCNAGATCDGAVTVIATAADPDADGLADPIDNCPDVANGDQLDVDQDGIGDACDRQSCGNGLQEYTETCDHGLDNGVDGLCDASCAYIGGGTACSDGVDNDGDGKVDTGDPGCANGADTSERDAAKVCDDGVDNDGDYRGDVNGDPGCGTSPNSIREDPACNDGIDNDGDGKVDYDGFGGFYEPDPNCGIPNKNKETANSCGLGFELMLLLPLLMRLRARRGAGTRSPRGIRGL